MKSVVINLLNRRQVAEALGVHTETVKRYTYAGLLPAVKFNPRTVRYEPEAVESFIASARIGGKAA